MKLLLLLLLATIHRAEGNFCAQVAPGQVSASVGFIFDFAANTALVNSRSLVLSKLNSSIFIPGITGGNDKMTFGSACGCNLAATVSQPSTGITECQAALSPTSFPSKLSCPLLSTTDFPNFMSCLNGLTQTGSQSDLISALSRVWNSGTNCNGMFNDNVNLIKPCQNPAPTTSNNSPSVNNVLVIFWSSPIADPAQVASWLKKFYADNYINIVVVPFVGTSGSSANKADFDAIQNNWNVTMNGNMVNVGNTRMAIYPPVTTTVTPTTTTAPPPANANDIDDIMAYLQTQILYLATNPQCPTPQLNYTASGSGTALAKTVCSIYADPNGNASAPVTDPTKVTLNDNQCSPPPAN